MNEEKLKKLYEFTIRAAQNGVPDAEINAILQKNGTNIDQLQGVAPYVKEFGYAKGAAQIDSLNARAKEFQESQPQTMLGKAWAGFKDAPLTAIGGGVKAAIGSTAGMLNAATAGASDWAAEKLGLDPKAARQEIMDEIATEAPTLRGVAGAAQGVGEMGAMIASPVTRALMPMGGAGSVAGRIGQAAANAGIYGGISSAFESDFDPTETVRGAALSAGTGALFQGGIEGARGVGVALQRAGNTAKRLLQKTPIVGGLEKTADDYAQGVFELTGTEPSMESTGAAMRQVVNQVNADVRGRASALYDKAEQMAANSQAVIDKNSALGRKIAELSQNTTKTGQRELNRIWNELGHQKWEPTNYNTLKELSSTLGEKAASGGTLSKHAYGELQAAVKQDMESMIGKDAKRAFDAANEFYRTNIKSPNSIGAALDKLSGVSDSVLGNRAISSATGKAWKASELKRVLDYADDLGIGGDVRNSIQSNIITKAQFNRMSPDQRTLIYGNRLPAARKVFSSVFDVVESVPRTVGDYVLKYATPVSQSRAAPKIGSALGLAINNLLSQD